MSYLKPEDRGQQELLPATVDDYIGQNNPIRAVDHFVESLDLASLGFAVRTDSSPQQGRPGYHPATMLKLYLWGYLNQIRSSRKLERACRRNVEVMWLLQKMAPDHSTI